MRSRFTDDSLNDSFRYFNAWPDRSLSSSAIWRRVDRLRGKIPALRQAKRSILTVGTDDNSATEREIIYQWSVDYLVENEREIPVMFRAPRSRYPSLPVPPSLDPCGSSFPSPAPSFSFFFIPFHSFPFLSILFHSTTPSSRPGRSVVRDTGETTKAHQPNPSARPEVAGKTEKLPFRHLHTLPTSLSFPFLSLSRDL